MKKYKLINGSCSSCTFKTCTDELKRFLSMNGINCKDGLTVTVIDDWKEWFKVEPVKKGKR